MSGNIKFNGWINDDGTENYKCRAWVNFQGTGTVAIRASGGVSSITDNGLGDYTILLTTAMVDVNYVVAGSSGLSGTTASQGRSFAPNTTAPTTTQYRLNIKTTANANIDDDLVYVVFFR